MVNTQSQSYMITEGRPYNLYTLQYKPRPLLKQWLGASEVKNGLILKIYPQQLICNCTARIQEDSLWNPWTLPANAWYGIGRGWSNLGYFALFGLACWHTTHLDTNSLTADFILGQANKDFTLLYVTGNLECSAIALVCRLLRILDCSSTWLPTEFYSWTWSLPWQENNVQHFDPKIVTPWVLITWF